MALEISPAPAKLANPERGEATGRNSNHPAKGKGAPSDPAGFLALLMSLDSQSVADPVSDVHAPVATETDPTQATLTQDGLPAALIAPVVVDQPIPLAMVVPTAAPDSLARQASLGSGLTQDTVGAKNTAVMEVDEKGKSPVPDLSSKGKDVSGLLETRSLQADLQKSQLPQVLARESNGASHEVNAPPSVQFISPVAEEPQKAVHANHAKTDLTEGVVALSGLSGALAGTPDLTPVDKSMPFQSVVAQEVSYYISQDIQNAEMKVEGLGGAAVEVSINMQGKEAQVVFRTDELQTREMLENASAHLKDMLGQEGVQLTGVFVGTSGSGDSGPQDRKFRPGARTELALKIQPAELRGGVNTQSSVGRTLDLYV